MNTNSDDIAGRRTPFISSGTSNSDSIVVVGMACRFPDAATPRELWENVLARRQAFRRIPQCRLRLADYHSSEPDAADLTYLTEAAVLDGWEFDRERFRVPGSVYRSVDPTHWLALEVADDALRDAGVPEGAGLDRTRVGVVLGNSLTGEFSRAGLLRTRWPYVRRAVDETLGELGWNEATRDDVVAALEQRFKRPFTAPNEETLAGGLSNTIAGRVCNHYDFHGTGYTVDGACASSLLAIVTACAALEQGELDFALAGGIDLSLDPFELVGFSRLGALAEGPMRVYDAQPTGFLPGEGCGVVALTRLSTALSLGLRPYARVAGWGTSSDGNGGLTRPEAAGQRLALDRAYSRAGFGPESVEFFEGHGTGTGVGDQAELETLTAVRRAAAGRERSAALGSIKANIGHTKAAAGAAGFCKAVLALHHEVIPPTTGCERPHPLLAEPDAALRVAHEAQPWPAGIRRTAVSAMGFGGINAHLALEGRAPTQRTTLVPAERELARPAPDREVFALSAPNVGELAQRLRGLLYAAPELSRAELTDLAATLSAQDPLEIATARVAIVATTPHQLTRRLERAVELVEAGVTSAADTDADIYLGHGDPARVGLLFSGQASPVPAGPGALGCLLPTVAELFTDELFAGGPDASVPDTGVAQPGIVRASLAGLRWLDRLGVSATATLGHSLGEISALCWAGALDEPAALDLARTRGAIMSRLGVSGAMASVAAPYADVSRLVDGTSLVVAVDNGLAQVVSGRVDEIEQLLARAVAEGLVATRLPVSHAFHSPLMAGAAGELEEYLARLPLAPLSQTVVSAVTARPLEPDADLAALLTGQLTAPVRFAEALTEVARHCDLLVEVGPGAVLTGIARQLTGCPVLALDAGTPTAAGIASATAALYASGATVSVRPYHEGRHSRRFDLARERRFLANPCEQADSTNPRVFTPASNGGPAGYADHTSQQGQSEQEISTGDPLTAVTALLARELELDPKAIPAGASLLGDLHLNSLRVVQLAAEAAGRLGRAIPAVPLSLAGATVEQLAAALAELPEAGDEQPAGAVAGLGSWVRAFEHILVPEAPRPVPAEPAAGEPAWQLTVATGHPLRDHLQALFTPGDGPPVFLLALAPSGGQPLADPPIETIADALRHCAATATPLVVVHHGGVGAAVGRSLVAEHLHLPVLVVEAPASAAALDLAAGEARSYIRAHGGHGGGFAEVRFDEAGTRHALRTLARPLPPRDDTAIPLDIGEVCIVTGGAKGIGAECALALGQATGAHLALLGRSPTDDSEVAATLQRLSAAGCGVSYHEVDVGDPGATARVLATVRAQHGPVRGIVHAAGRNQPASIEHLDAAAFEQTLAPKVDGLRSVLAGLEEGEPRLLVSFGSVIGRIGLPGETHYALANEWLARAPAELVALLPGCRCLTIEWSIWSGAGMGERLGALDQLTRQGIDPIPVTEGTDVFLRLLAQPDTPGTVLVTGRLPAMATLRYADQPPPLARFLESWRTHTPGVELVADATLSLDADPYLDDHRIDGVAVLPAVLGLEAMAQAACAVSGNATAAGFHDVELAHPVTVPDGGVRTIRVAALVRDDGLVDVAVRSEETGFATDHFRATCRPAVEPAAGDSEPGAQTAGDGEPPEPHPYYSNLFFHGPRFARFGGYMSVSALGCRAHVRADAGASWFGGFHAQTLVLGDPGARDASIHLLQACVPHRRVLPVSVEEINLGAPPHGELTVTAHERSHDAGTYVFDVDVVDAADRLVERWRGLQLRDVGTAIEWQSWPIELLAPYLARVAQETHGEATLDARAVPTASGTGGAAAANGSVSLDAVRELLGEGCGASHGPDGRIVVTAGAASASHYDGHVLVAVGGTPVAVDWESTVGAGSGDWPLDADAARLVEAIAGHTGEPPDIAAARVWTCLEVLSKRGLATGAPLTLDGVDTTTGGEAAGWLRLRCGATTLSSTVVALDGDVPVAVALGVG